MTGTFTYRSEWERCSIGERELHCGDTFEMQMLDGSWQNTRIELAEDWYLIGLPGWAADYDGRQARME